MSLPLLAFLIGCNVDSTTGVPSDNTGTLYNFAGLYLNPNNSTSTDGALPLVYPNEGSSRPSGTLISSLRLLQYGNSLEAYDSASQTWSGSISTIQSGTANFTLSGRTTAGQAVEIAGTMVYAEQNSTMNASWIEPNYYGTIIATATVPPATTDDSDDDDTDDGDTDDDSTDGDDDGDSSILSIEPGFYMITSESSTPLSFTVSGGTAPYTWRVSDESLGTLAATTGATNAYTTTPVVGSNDIIVTDSSDETVSAYVIYQ